MSNSSLTLILLACTTACPASLNLSTDSGWPGFTEGPGLGNGLGAGVGGRGMGAGAMLPGDGREGGAEGLRPNQEKPFIALLLRING